MKYVTRLPLTRRLLFSCLAISFGFLEVNSHDHAVAEENADLIKIFQSEYPAAAARLEAAYEHVRLDGKLTRSDNKGKIISTDHVEILRDGRFAIRSEITLESFKPGLAVGTRFAGGGESEKSFEVFKNPNQANFTIASFGQKKSEDFDRKALLNCYPAYAPYRFSFDVTPIWDYVNQKFQRLLKAQPAKLDGVDVVEVVLEKTIPGEGVLQVTFFSNLAVGRLPAGTSTMDRNLKRSRPGTEGFRTIRAIA